jgi:hypothetical protein
VIAFRGDEGKLHHGERGIEDVDEDKSVDDSERKKE